MDQRACRAVLPLRRLNFLHLKCEGVESLSRQRTAGRRRKSHENDFGSKDPTQLVAVGNGRRGGGGYRTGAVRQDVVTEEADNEIAESEVNNGETTNTSEDTAESTEVDQEEIIEEEPIVCTYNTVTMQDVSVTSCGPYTVDSSGVSLTVDYSGIRTSINADSSCFVEQTGGHFTG